MDRFKDVAKKGWHPDKGTTLKQQAKFWKKDDTTLSSDKAAGHSSAPLSTLKDPSSFGPPPKRTGAVPSPTTYASASPTTPTFSGSGYQSSQAQVSEDDVAPAPKGPWRMDTTGLSTAHLPPPPGRGVNSPVQGVTPAPPPYNVQAKPKPPSLPPRLPPRSAVTPAPQSEGVTTAAPGGYLNQGAVGRLGAAGISVPGFGIGGGQGASNAPPPPERSPTSSSAGVGGLQSRFAKLGTGSAQSTAEQPRQGTSFAQKQDALRTAANFRQDPSSVSASDLRSAASTANNFRQRHGEQVAAGVQGAQGLNQKYGLSNKIGQYGGSAAEAPETPVASVTSGLRKKPPPPVPNKRVDLAGAVRNQGGDAPPPVPTSTRPQF